MGRKKLVEPEDVHAALERWFLEHGQAPTVQELTAYLGVGSTRTTHRYLNELEEKGIIRRWQGARGVRLLRRADTGGTTTRSVPLLGEAPAGPFLLAEENLEGHVRLPVDLLHPRGAAHFLLRVRGDSMNRSRVRDETIEDGDLVLVRQQPTARSGDVVVALVDGEVTIKRLAKGSGYWILKPESRAP